MPSAKLERFLAESSYATPFLVVDLDVIARALPEPGRGGAGAYPLRGEGQPGVGRARAAGRVGFGVRCGQPRRDRPCAWPRAPIPPICPTATPSRRRATSPYAYSCGVRIFTVDVEPSSTRSSSHAPGADVCVRLFHEGAGADWPLSRKFGCAEPEALELLTVAHRAGSRTGLSFHVGSQQRDARRVGQRARRRSATCSPALPTAMRRPSFVNLGGGLPGHYREPVASLRRYADAINRALSDSFGDTPPTLLIEPGRYLVADAGVLRTEVVLVSRTRARRATLGLHRLRPLRRPRRNPRRSHPLPDPHPPRPGRADP